VVGAAVAGPPAVNVAAAMISAYGMANAGVLGAGISPSVAGSNATGFAGAVAGDSAIVLGGASASSLAGELINSNLPGVFTLGGVGALAGDSGIALGGASAAGLVGASSNSNPPGVFALGATATVSTAGGGGISFVGCVATTVVGTLRPLAPSSSLGLWGVPVAGGIVTLTFSDPSIAGLPASVAVTVGSGETITQVTTALVAAINASTVLQGAGLTARSSANILTLTQPTPAMIYAELLMTGT